MAELNFAFLFVCIIILSFRLVKAGGRISKLEGKVESLLIFLREKEDRKDGKNG